MSVVVNDTTKGAATTLAKTFAQVDRRFTEAHWCDLWNELSRRVLVDCTEGSRQEATDQFVASLAITLSHLAHQIDESGWVMMLKNIVDAFVTAAAGAGIGASTIAGPSEHIARTLAHLDARYTEANWASALSDWSVAIAANLAE